MKYNHKKRFLTLFSILGVIFAVAIWGYYRFESFLYEEFCNTALPNNIQPSSAVLIDSYPSPLINMLPLFRNESCGAAIFNLSEQTLTNIKTLGLNYLDTSRLARGRNILYESSFMYEKWQESPLPKTWTDHKDSVLWSGLSCVKLDPLFVSELYKAADSSGSYFTYNNVATLVVIPRLKIAIYSWYDL